VPKAVVEAKDIVMAADGLVLASPEYNGGVPGVLKNALDWLSRPPPPKAAALRGKPVALLGATPGGLGTALAQAGWLQILRSLRMELWVGEGPLTVSRAGDAFDQEGRIVDAALAERVEAYIHAFVRSLQR
jgi:NAD(P)H-dependent FMN reductase